MENDVYKKSRLMYIFEAALEYLVSILVANSFLATLTKYIGMSDGLTGIISSFISLGCVFQLISLFIRRPRMKPFVVTFSIINQLLFLLLYVIPVINISGTIKAVIFTVSIFTAYLTYNIAHPAKINWFMSLVDDGIRGRFTANKEIVSLLSGMVFTYAMGSLVDRFEAAGKIEMAFIVSAVVIFVLMVLHTLTMLFSKEKDIYKVGTEKMGIFREKVAVLKDKNVIRVTVVFILWNIAMYSTLPFFGTYQIKELGFSLTFVSVLQIVSGFLRMTFSRFMGSFADKKSFAVMIRLCFTIAAVGFVFTVFCVPKNGRLFFAAYSALNAIAMSGINSALINLVFDSVEPEKRADSLAISQALSGVAGFLSTLCISALVMHIQRSGNIFFGINIYAQQVASFIGLIFTLASIVYVSVFLIGKKGKGSSETVGLKDDKCKVLSD